MKKISHLAAQKLLGGSLSRAVSRDCWLRYRVLHGVFLYGPGQVCCGSVGLPWPLGVTSASSWALLDGHLYTLHSHPAPWPAASLFLSQWLETD